MERNKTLIKENDKYQNLSHKTLGRVNAMTRSEKIKLRRTQGLTLRELKPDEKIIFYSLIPSDSEPALLHNEYIISCLLFGVQVACAQDGDLSAKAKVQDILADEYKKGKSKSAMSRIEAFMACDGHNNKMFFKDLSRLLSQFIKKEKVNVFSLTDDLIKWNYGGRDKWLNALISIKQNELEKDIEITNI